MAMTEKSCPPPISFIHWLTDRNQHRAFTGTRPLIATEPRLSPPDNPYRFAPGQDVASFCKVLFRRRNELIHRGKSPGTDAEVTHAASTLCRKVLLLAIADHYCSRSPS